jgi:CO/xanthine dehydrogenase FAD-binding subunit
MVSHKPTTLKGALEIRACEKVIPYAGGTDLMIEAEPEASYLFLADVPELKTIERANGNLEIGAAVTFTQGLDSPLIPEILKEAVRYIAAPAIRNAGTFGGNIANGSAKADSALIFSVTDSVLVLSSEDGERRVPIGEFYLGRGKTCLKENELLTKIVMPLQNVQNYYYHKVGARGALAIARVSFAGLMRTEGGIIRHAATAYGAVAGTILRRADIDGILIGRTVEEAKKIRGDYLSAMDEAIQPIRGRISAEYRKKVLMNLIADFLTQNGITG